MSRFVSTEEVKQQLRIDGTDDDEWIAIALAAIESAVSLWVGNDAALFASDGVTPVDAVRIAVLVEIAYQYRFREGAAEQSMGDWYSTGYVLNMSSTALLTPLRSIRTA